jgi:hypothetical protein
MNRLVGGILVLLLALPAAWAEDKPKEKKKDAPASPAEEYKALVAEYQKASNAFQDAIRAAKTREEQMKVFREKDPQASFAPKFVALAEKHPKDPVAVDALIWVLTNSRGGPAEKGPQARAIDILVRHHIQSEKLGPVFQSLSFGMDKGGDTFLRAVLEKNKSKEFQAEACLALAQRLQQRADAIRRVKDSAEMAKLYENFFGKEATAELTKSDPAKVEAESATLFKRLADRHLADMKPERLKSMCQTLSFSGGKGSTVLLRTILEKDSRAEVQGLACLTLAQVLKRHADDLAATDAKEATKVRAEAEKLFERAADKYANVKQGFGGTVGAKAKSELFDLRFLSVGKAAPAVEGQDQDGKKFKLSDYKGKVVFLDFWSQY